MQLGKYELLEILGQGSFGVVYKARDLLLNRDAALKVIHSALAQDQKLLQSLSSGAQTLASFDHPNIVRLYEFGEANGQTFLAYQFLPGGDLTRLIKQKGKLPLADALKIARQLVDGLSYAHQRGVVHRDIKPSNVMLDENGNAALTDFNLTQSGKFQSAATTLMGGTSIGTPFYKAPELWRGEKPSPASDQYSLACLFAEMLTGRVLFDGDTPAQVVTRHFESLQLPQDLPYKIRPVLQKALEKDPSRRFPDLQEFLRAAEMVGLPQTQPETSEQTSAPVPETLSVPPSPVVKDEQPDTSLSAQPADEWQSLPVAGTMAANKVQEAAPAEPVPPQPADEWQSLPIPGTTRPVSFAEEAPAGPPAPLSESFEPIPDPSTGKISPDAVQILPKQPTVPDVREYQPAPPASDGWSQAAAPTPAAPQYVPPAGKSAKPPKAEKKGSGCRTGLIILGVFVAIAALVGIIFAVVNNRKPAAPDPTATPTAVSAIVNPQAPTAIPTDVPAAAPTAVPSAIPTAISTPIPSPTALPTQPPTAVPTATPVPTALPTLPAVGALLYQDDFSTADNTWFGSFEGGGTEVLGGVAQFTVNKASWQVWQESSYVQAKDVIIDVDGLIFSGPADSEYGLLCRYVDADNHYGLTISGDGFVSIFERVAGEIESLYGEFSEGVIDPTVNHITAACIGDTLSIYANGIFLASVKDGSHVSGDVGLIAGTWDDPGAVVRFDNLKVSSPAQAQTSAPTAVPGPKLPSNLTLLYQDDFASQQSNWGWRSNDSSIVENIEGTLQFTALKTDYLSWTKSTLVNVSDMVITVEGQLLSGGNNNQYGVVCRYIDGDNYYALTLASNGYVEIFRQLADDYENLYTGMSTGVINPSLNRITASCIGDTLSLYANGVLLASVQDSSHASGDAGMIVDTADDVPAVVRFDNFAVWIPD